MGMAGLTEPRVRRALERATERLNQRKARLQAQGIDPWSDAIFTHWARWQDRLSMIWGIAAAQPAERAIHESRQLAREELDLPNASERELDNAIYRRLK